MSDPPPAAPPPAHVRAARRVVAAGLVLGLVVELVTVVARFGLGLQATRDTGLLARVTFGLRVHHGYVGVVLLLLAPLVRLPPVRRALGVVGVALVASDLLHHFAVLWPVTGSPQFDFFYPPGAADRPPAGWLFGLLTAAPAAGWALWLAEWAVRLTMLAVVPARRPPGAAAAWLLLIFLAPWLGLLVYLLIGSPRMPRWRRERLLAFERDTAGLRRTARAAAGTRAVVTGPMAPAARLARRLGRLPPVGGNAVELLADTGDLMARLAADIDAATHHAHLLYYIAAADRSTEPVLAALVRAAGRGVRCRLVYDWQGSRRGARGLLDRLAGTGVEVRAALPLRVLSRRATRTDLRNHRKVAVVDGRAGYVGSHNFVDPGFLPGLVYEDLTARVRGPLVPQLQMVFTSDWWLEAGERLTDGAYFPAAEPAGEAVGQVLASGPEFPAQNFQRVLVDVAHRARRRLTLVTPYLVPDEPLLHALETAARRGAAVRLVVAGVVDQPLVRLCQESYYSQLLAAGAEVHQYRGRFLHAKLAVADDTLAVVGTCNADIRSFQLNAEVSLLLYDPASVAAAAELEAGYLTGADRLTAAAWAGRPRWRRPAEGLARLFSPLL